MKEQKKRPKTLEETQGFAVAHWIRIEALTVLNERVASPNEIGRRIGVGLNQVGHHIKELREAACIDLVRIEPRGGSAEHFYRAIKRPEISDEEWAVLPDEARREIVAAVFRNLTAEGLSSIRAGKMSADRYLCLSWKAVNVDEQGKREIADEQQESMERQLRIEEKATNRMAKSGEKGTSTIIATLSFPRSRNVEPSDKSWLPGEA